MHSYIFHIFCLFLVTSKLSLIDTHFEPDYSRMSMKKFVSCAPGFGIREVFCAACPPHHYSPDKSIECLKCAKGFHQPIAGSEKCVKCRNIFSSGCYMVSGDLNKGLCIYKKLVFSLALIRPSLISFATLWKSHASFVSSQIRVNFYM